MKLLLRSSAAALALVALTVQPGVTQQPNAFDMSPEKPAQAPAVPSLQLPVRPPVVTPAAPPVAPAAPVVPQRAQPPAAVAPQPAKPAAQAPTVADTDMRRYLVPGGHMVLDGEYSRRMWSVYLTEQQAAIPAKLEFAYQNSIVVAPEVSKLSIIVNGRQVAQQAISSPDTSRAVIVSLPPDVLEAGANQIEFRANQRHRTDCDIQSTYDLWTEIDPTKTFLDFERAAPFTPSIAEAIRSIGPDAAGRTEFQILMPAIGQPGATAAIMRLTQGLSILSGMPNQVFTFRPAELQPSAPGRFGVVIGTAAELQRVYPQLPPAAQTMGVATLMPDARTGSNVLLISGPSWDSVKAAAETIVSPLDRPLEVRRDVISTQRWSSPDAPLLFGGEQIPLSQMGVETVEFPGRRVRTNFNIAVPSDFYANAYGEARLLLDAAFSDAVLPGSHLDVYVNGNIASTVPITSSKGGIFRHLPIKVTLRHLKPGVNTVSLEAIIMTEADKVCAPGSTASNEPRMAIFNTSEWQMPTFARIGRSPNLSALAGTGFPYGRMSDPLLLSMDRFDADTIAATATFMAQLALVAGHPIPTELLASPNAIGERNAIFVGTASQMPPKLLSQLNIAPDIASAWRPTSDAPAANADTSAAFDAWRSRVSGGAWRGQISAFQEWLQRNFNLSSSSLQFLPGSETIFQPSPAQSLVIAQGNSPEGGATWTAVTAPTPEELRLGVEAITFRDRWQNVDGRLTAYAGRTGEVASIPVNRFEFMAPSMGSLNNYRLIVANWMSSNILSYAVLLVGLSTLLGVATAAMLANLGRRK